MITFVESAERCLISGSMTKSSTFSSAVMQTRKKNLFFLGRITTVDRKKTRPFTLVNVIWKREKGTSEAPETSLLKLFGEDDAKRGNEEKKITPESDKRRQNRKTPLTPTGYGHFSLWRPFSLSREIN